MSKIYRLHSGEVDDIRDWTRITGYLDTTQINNIKDGAGANARKPITSIPSPFALIDLVKTAFKQVVASGAPEGISIYHKLVSDTLDVGQVFFNSPHLKQQIRVHSWNPGLRWAGAEPLMDEQGELWRLIHQGSGGNRLYGETLKMFLSQDAAEYNFDKLRQFHLLDYSAGQDHFNIIGGTSPATLFFPSANKLDYVDMKINGRRLFHSICPLYERSEDYVLFLYALREAMPGFRTAFRVMDNYLDLCLKKLSPDVRSKAIALSSDSYEQQYDSIVLSAAGNYPEINGFELRCVRVDDRGIAEKSDFVIAASHPKSGLLPLVLPAYAFNTRMNYIDNPWPTELKAPYADNQPIDKRTLPGQQRQYPYLTVSDLLEPYLVQLPFEPDEDRFFCGHLPKGFNDGYLLPLTPVFFEYFSPADLQQTLPDGKQMFQLERLAHGAIKATLRVPVTNGRYIEMIRTYTADAGQGEPDIRQNQGFIRELQFSMAIYPFVQQTDDVSYTIMFLARGATDKASRPYSLKYYRSKEVLEEVRPKVQRQKSNVKDDLIDTFYDMLSSGFDFITVASGKVRGCLAPLLEAPRSSGRKFSFAIDFGTTNTHIEYNVDGGPLQPFDITREDPQLGTLHRWNDATYGHLSGPRFGVGATLMLEKVPKEMMPDYIGGTARHRFPLRTAVTEPLQVDMNRETYPLVDFSVYWQQDNTINRAIRTETNLKWGSLSEPLTERRVAGYLANLVLLLRNKVLINGGDLAQTKIVWFYPTSMSKARRSSLESTWDKLIAQYLGAGIEVTGIPESVAPFYFFSKRGTRGGSVPVINIDIGGGTTDVVIYKNDEITAYTSFKYAGNALFGDGYGAPPDRNGFVQFFEKQHRQHLEQTPLNKYLPAKGQVQRSDDFITTLFGLQDHPDRKETYFSLTEQLRATSELKIVPLLFISSIFYHVARYQKTMGDKAPPRYITFSGTASKMIHILDVGKKLPGITNLANHIFNEVFDTRESQIELVMEAGPKEVTAKGGLCNPVVPKVSKTILFGTEEGMPGKQLTYADAFREDTQEIVLKEVNAFIDRFFSWNVQMGFADEFGLNTKRFAEFKKTLKKDLHISLSVGIDELKKEVGQFEDDGLKETLFFMPLRGALHQLAFTIIDTP
ncbi:cell division protein FtsA [Taibaiella koreensis]|uniref:hypothetical protein n=1 Tax=Taibaiella koreensis TaxID=1268548 RepID=UPI000E59A25A|nr:hypothetical protein [Taibaiella koreensis]